MVAEIANNYKTLLGLLPELIESVAIGMII
jgi:hypothetical protein